MLPRGPANAAAHAYRDPLVARPRERLHHGRAPNVCLGRRQCPRAPLQTGGRCAQSAIMSRQEPCCPRVGLVDFRPRRGGETGAGPVPSLRAFSRQCQGLPIAAARDRPAARRRGSPVGSPVLKLWNESRTNRARIADSIPVGFRSRPYIVVGRCPATKSCNRTDTMPLGGRRLVNARLARRKLVGWRSDPGAEPHRTAIIASSRRPCPVAGLRRIASPA